MSWSKAALKSSSAKLGGGSSPFTGSKPASTSDAMRQFGNIFGSGVQQTGQQAAHALSNGFNNGMNAGLSDIRSAGSQAANTLVGAFVEPFGASGVATQQLSQRVNSAVNTMLNTAFGSVGNVLSAGGRLAGAGAGAVGIVGGGAIGLAVGGPAGLMAGVGVGSMVGSVMGDVVSTTMGAVGDLFGGVVKVVGEASSELAGVATQGFKSGIEILKDSTDSLLQKAKQVQQLSNQTGWGVGASYNAIQTAQALGVPVGAIPHQNMMLQRLNGRIYGGSGDFGSEDVTAFRNWYKPLAERGGMSLMYAQDWAKAAGKGAYIDAAMMDSDSFNRAMSGSRALNGAFGLDPGQMQQAQQTLQVNLNLFGQLTELLKSRLAADALPYINRALSGTIDYITNNADKIKSGIKSAVSWVFETLPTLITTGLAKTLHGLSAFSGGVSDFSKNLASNVKGVLGGTDALLNGLREGAATLYGLGGGVKAFFAEATKPASEGTKRLGWDPDRLTKPTGTDMGFFNDRWPSPISKVADKIADPITSAWDGIQAIRSNKYGEALADRVFNPVGNIANVVAGLNSGYDSYFKARADFLNMVPESNLAGKYGQPLEDMLNRTAGGAGDLGSKLEQLADSIDRMIAGGGSQGPLVKEVRGLRDDLRKMGGPPPDANRVALALAEMVAGINYRKRFQ